MHTYYDYSKIPKHAVYLGSESGGGMCEELFDAIDAALDPVRLVDDGVIAYFDIAKEI